MATACGAPALCLPASAYTHSPIPVLSRTALVSRSWNPSLGALIDELYKPLESSHEPERLHTCHQGTCSRSALTSIRWALGAKRRHERRRGRDYDLALLMRCTHTSIFPGARARPLVATAHVLTVCGCGACDCVPGTTSPSTRCSDGATSPPASSGSCRRSAVQRRSLPRPCPPRPCLSHLTPRARLLLVSPPVCFARSAVRGSAAPSAYLRCLPACRARVHTPPRRASARRKASRWTTAAPRSCNSRIGYTPPRPSTIISSTTG